MSYVEDLRKIVGHRPLILVGAVTIIINDKRIVMQKQMNSINIVQEAVAK